MPDSIPSYEQVVDAVLDQVKRIVFPEEWLKLDLALSKQEVFALLLVDRRGEIIMTQIADYINVSLSTATGIVDRLVKNGLLERARSDSDRRVVLIKLTEKAKALVQEIKNIGSRYISLISNAMTDEERRFFFKIAARILAIVNDQAGDGHGAGKNVTPVTEIPID